MCPLVLATPATAQVLPQEDTTLTPVFVVRANGQSWGDAVRKLAKSSTDAEAVAAAWKKTSKGEPQSVTDADGSASPEASAAFSFSDPNTWSVSGSASSDLWYWTGLKNVVEGAYCSSSCTVTDRVTARSTVNPGTTSSTIATSFCTRRMPATSPRGAGTSSRSARR